MCAVIEVYRQLMGWAGGARSSAVLQGHAGTHGAHGDVQALC